MAEPNKRVHYFDHQFLREKDFADEQEYHIGMRRLHNRMLHTWGIAEGLTLSFASGASRAAIREGVAMDGQGRELMLTEAAQTPDLSGLAGKIAFITIAYAEQPTDPTEETGVTGNTRWTESPIIEVVENAPEDPSQQLILGRVRMAADGTISGVDEGEAPNRRRAAGVVGGDLEVRSLALTDPDVVSTQWPRMRLSAPNRTDLTGSLRITADASVDGNVGIGTPTPTQRLDVVGTVKATAFQGNGAALTGVRGVDATKVAKAGDTMTGPLAITAADVGLNITNHARVGGNLVIGRNVGIGIEPVTNLHVAGDVQIDGRLVAPRKQGYVVDQFVNHRGEALEQGDVVVIGENQASLYYGPGNSVPIPEVDTTERTYDTRVCGIVSEVHGETMPTAREPANPSARRRRRPEVTGVRSFTPDELAQLDRTQIQPGQIGGMVTLGAYAYCKVDADIAPIQVGDLLTTSPTKRHAQKVLDPSQAVGAILGKALGSLTRGQGKIPVLVMLQ